MGLIQGLDAIPNEIVKVDSKWAPLFAQYLPGWDKDGIYNFSPGAATNKIAAQLQIPLQYGSHPWINDAIKDLFFDVEGNETSVWKAAGDIPGERTRLMAVLVNYMHEATGEDAIKSKGAKTGGYIAYSHRADPDLLQRLGYEPTVEQMRQTARANINWDAMKASQAGQEVLALNFRIANGALDYDEQLSNKGFFSKASSQLGTWKIYTSYPSWQWWNKASSQFSREWVKLNKITIGLGGAILKDNVEYRLTQAKTLLATKLQDGTRIATKFNLPTKVLADFAKATAKHLKVAASGLGRAAPVITIAVLAFAASPAMAAQTQPEYVREVAVPANKKFIEELFATGVGGLAGMVAGALAGAASFGLLALPVAVGAGLAGDATGRALGGYFYDNFTEVANDLAEWVAPLLAPIGDFISAVGDTAGDAADILEDAIYEIAGTIFDALAGAFEYVSDQVTGVDGIFGLNGPLFGPEGPLHALVARGKEAGFLTGEGTWVYDGFDSILYGTDGDDILIHDEGLGQAYGGEGDDILVGLFPAFAAAGTPYLEDSPDFLAAEDMRLTLDGGEGNDWVITILGDKATTIGGLGRDWIYNTSAEGIIWGDIANSVERSDGSRVALVDGQAVEIADTAANADNFWYSGGTTIMDAQRHDVLKFFGVTLTGGEVGSSAWSLFAGARSGSLLVAGTVNGLAATAAASVNAIRGRAGQSRIYYDTFLPFIAYTLQDNNNGGQDLVVTNLVTAGIGAAFFGLSGEASRMIVKDYDIAKVGGFTSGFDALGGARTGDLGMLFRDFNPAYAIAVSAGYLNMPMVGIMAERDCVSALNDNECARNVREVA